MFTYFIWPMNTNRGTVRVLVCTESLCNSLADSTERRDLIHDEVIAGSSFSEGWQYTGYDAAALTDCKA